MADFLMKSYGRHCRLKWHQAGGEPRWREALFRQLDQRRVIIG